MPTDVVVDQAAPVSDEISKLANHFPVPEDYDLTWKHPETKAVGPLSKELTFAEQNVLEHSILYLKPKGAAALKAEMNIWDEPSWGEYKSEMVSVPSPSSPRAHPPATNSPQNSPIPGHHEREKGSSLEKEKAKGGTIATATFNKMLEHLTSPDAYGIYSLYLFECSNICIQTLK